jgi:hypothetical protein
MADQTTDTFDADLARIEEIGRTHDVSAPYKSDTCVAADYNKAREHRGFLLGFIDKLWNEYSRTLQKLDDRVAERPSVEQFIDRLKSAGWTARYDAQWEGITKLHAELFPGHGNATTDADRQVGARTAGEAPASDGDSVCPAVPASVVRAYDEAMQAHGVPHEPLAVYTSNSWVRVGLARKYREVMTPDNRPDIRSASLLEALVAAFNTMLTIRPTRERAVTEQPMALFDVLQAECGTSIAERLVEAICRAGLRVENVAWQPMETAPKDRNILLVREAFEGTPRYVTHGYWFEEEHGKQIGDCGGACHCPEYEEPCDPFWFSDDGGFTKEHPPVGWMDLPAPPSVIAGDK